MHMEIHKYVEIKWHVTKKLMGQRKNKKKFKNILRYVKIEIQHLKTYGMQQK